jgi:hypothetical protein
VLPWTQGLAPAGGIGCVRMGSAAAIEVVMARITNIKADRSRSKVRNIRTLLV